MRRSVDCSELTVSESDIVCMRYLSRKCGPLIPTTAGCPCHSLSFLPFYLFFRIITKNTFAGNCNYCYIASGRGFGWWKNIKLSLFFQKTPVEVWASDCHAESIRHGLHLSPNLCENPGCMCDRGDPARTVVAGSLAHKSVKDSQLANQNKIDDAIDAERCVFRRHVGMAGYGASSDTVTKAQYPENDASGALGARKRALTHPVKRNEQNAAFGIECARDLSDARDVIVQAKLRAVLSRALHWEYWKVARHKFTGAATKWMRQFEALEQRGVAQSTKAYLSCSPSSPPSTICVDEQLCVPCAIGTVSELLPTSCSRLAILPSADVVTEMTHFWSADMESGRIIGNLGMDTEPNHGRFIQPAGAVGALSVQKVADAICHVSGWPHQQVAKAVYTLHHDEITRGQTYPLMGNPWPSRDLLLSSLQGLVSLRLSMLCVDDDGTCIGSDNRLASMNRASKKNLATVDIGSCECALRRRSMTTIRRELFDSIQCTNNSHIGNHDSCRYATGTHQMNFGWEDFDGASLGDDTQRYLHPHLYDVANLARLPSGRSSLESTKPVLLRSFEAWPQCADGTNIFDLDKRYSRLAEGNHDHPSTPVRVRCESVLRRLRLRFYGLVSLNADGDQSVDISGLLSEYQRKYDEELCRNSSWHIGHANKVVAGDRKGIWPVRK